MTTDQPLQLRGADTLAFLSRVESTTPALSLIDIAEAYSLCAKLEANEDNSRLAYSLLDRLAERLDETDQAPREAYRLLARTRAVVAAMSLPASSPANNRNHQRQPQNDPMEDQPTRFTLSGLTRRHR